MGRRYLKPRNVKEFDQSWIDEINRCLAERDKLLDEMYAAPEIFSFGCAATDGVGGLTPLFAFGCTLQIAGSTVRMVFHKKRPNNEFVSAGIYVGDIARTALVPGIGSPSRTSEFADLRFRDFNNTPVNASTSAFTCLVWAFGPRA